MKHMFRMFLVVLAIFATSSVAFAERRRAVEVPAPQVNFQATMDYVATTGAWSRVFTELPNGSLVEYRVTGPDDKVMFDVTSVVNLGGQWIPGGAFMSTLSVGSPWNGPLPADWPKGVTKFETIVTLYGQTYTVCQKVAVGVKPTERIGPLDEAIPDAAGGVMLVGLFYASPIVVTQSRVETVSIQAGNYIPPGTVSFPAVITACSPVVAGDTHNLYCSTKVVGAQATSMP